MIFSGPERLFIDIGRQGEWTKRAFHRRIDE
jgi:hypothetical protein